MTKYEPNVPYLVLVKYPLDDNEDIKLLAVSHLVPYNDSGLDSIL